MRDLYTLARNAGHKVTILHTAFLRILTECFCLIGNPEEFPIKQIKRPVHFRTGPFFYYFIFLYSAVRIYIAMKITDRM